MQLLKKTTPSSADARTQHHIGLAGEDVNSGKNETEPELHHWARRLSLRDQTTLLITRLAAAKHVFFSQHFVDFGNTQLHAITTLQKVSDYLSAALFFTLANCPDEAQWPTYSIPVRITPNANTILR